MKKTLCKKIFWIMLVAVGVFVFNISNVNAEITVSPVGKIGDRTLTQNEIKNFDSDKYNHCMEVIRALNKETDDNSVLADRYAIDVQLNEHNNYVIKIPSHDISYDLRRRTNDKIEFKLVSMTFEDIILDKAPEAVPLDYRTDNRTFGVNKSIVVKRASYDRSLSKGYGLTEMVFVPVGFNDPDLEEACNYTVEKETLDRRGRKVKDTLHVSMPTPSFSISFEIEDAPGASRNAENITPIKIPDGNKPLSFDCALVAPGSFEAKFCEMKNKAIAQGNVVSDPSKERELSCDVKTIIPEDVSDEEKYYLEENKNYFYTEKEGKSFDYSYVYNYECGQEIKTYQCKVKCQEALSVEYGPPVAVKAGQCFSYKVRVTSRVVCKPDSEVVPPDGYDSSQIYYCTPTPSCSIKKSKAKALAEGTHRRGGPNEDFDACVEDCDGGKYTDKCSSQCYKRVYLNSISKSNGKGIVYATDDEDYDDEDYYDTSEVKIEKLKKKKKKQKTQEEIEKERQDALGYGFICNSSNQIFWYNGKNAKFVYTTITNFVEKPAHNRKYPKDKRDPIWYWSLKNGLGKRYQCFKDTGIPAACGCKEKCLWVGCGKGVYLNPSFPYQVEGHRTGARLRVGNAYNDLLTNVNTYQTARNACGATTSCQTRTTEYTIEVKKDDTNTFASEKATANSPGDNTSNKGRIIKHFDGCYDIRNENTDPNRTRLYQTEWTLPKTWMSSKTGEISYVPKEGFDIENSGKVCLPLTTPDVNSKWWLYYFTKRYGNDSTLSINSDSLEDECACNWKVNDVSESDITDWNILATVRNFGYFSWNFNMKCFYATKSKICTGGKDCQKEGKAIRTVDLKQLFPDKKGNYIEDSKVAGRTPGFNWSEFAKNTGSDTDYQSNPQAYMAWVQSMGYNVYSDEYLDYDIKLTRNTIRDLKSKLANNEYEFGNYNNVTFDNITTYKSELLESITGDEGRGNSIPNTVALRCNNIKDKNGSSISAACQNFN